MTRVTSSILVIMLLMNGTVTIMAGSGLSDDLGVTIAPGVEQTMDKTVSDAKNGFDASEGLGDTLFSLFAAAMNTFKLLIEAVFAAPQMMTNLGFPSWFIVPVFAPMYIISVFEFIFIATGRDPM